VSAPIRVAVIGGGLIAQAVHLPNLAAMADRFAVAAVADISPSVAAGLGERYAGGRGYTDWRELLASHELDAIVVCSPHDTHAEIVLAALDRGLHVFVEKPLCVVPEDAETICRRQRDTGLTVQVGYMKRFDAAYLALLDALPGDAERLRMIDTVTYDPWMAREPFVPWTRMLAPADVPADVLEAGRAEEAEQVRRAVGGADADTVRAYSYSFLACLVHDVNLAHGVLDALGVDARPEGASAAEWAAGGAASFTATLPGGPRWRGAWLLLDGQLEFRERATFYFTDGVYELELPVPYWPQAERRLRVARDAAVAIETFSGDAYVAELGHFADCIEHGAVCLTPPEQAARDIELLRDLFVKTRRSLVT
jgi:predicted dehydrogenase